MSPAWLCRQRAPIWGHLVPHSCNLQKGLSAIFCRELYPKSALYIYIQFWCESVPYLNKDYGDINIERFTVLPILCELHNLLDFVRLFTRHR